MNTDQPMTPTPRTDAQPWINRYPECREGAIRWVPADFARQLERENQTFRAAQKACEDCDAPRVDRIAELEREIAAEREQLAANHEATKLMGKWLEDERALADRLGNALAVYRGDVAHLGHWMPAGAVVLSDRALAAWKEARSA